MVHLDEFVEVNTVKIKDAAKMVPEYEIVSQFNNSFDLLGVIITQQ